jgi:hypothetical protein
MKSSTLDMGQIMTHIALLLAIDVHRLVMAGGTHEDCMGTKRRAGLVRCAQRTQRTLRRYRRHIASL